MVGVRQLVTAVGRYLGRFQRVWPSPRQEHARVLGGRRDPALSADHPEPDGRRDFVRVQGRLRCIRCLRSALVPSSLPPRCSAEGRRHRLWSAGPFIFCSACSSCSRENTVGLAKPCKRGVLRQGATAFRLNRFREACDLRTGAALGCSRPQLFGPLAMDAKFGGLIVLPDGSDENDHG